MKECITCGSDNIRKEKYCDVEDGVVYIYVCNDCGRMLYNDGSIGSVKIPFIDESKIDNWCPPRSNEEKITLIAKKNGVQTIKHLLLLELEELRQAIENNDEDNIIEEIQDVRILCEQYATMKMKRVESQEWYNFKIRRTMERLEIE